MTEQVSEFVAPHSAKPRRPWLAALLSLLATGVGQVYNGQWKKGVGFLVAELVLGLTMIPLFGNATSLAMLLAFLLGFNLFVAGEAYATAKGMREFVPGRMNRWWIYAAFLAGGLLLGLGFERVVQGQFYRTYKAPSVSMSPTILVGDHFMVDVLGSDDAVERGDIVIFRYPGNLDVDFVKRVIGLPGETVEIRDRAVFVDGQLLDEPYAVYSKDVAMPGRDDFGPYAVSDGKYFMMGDNRDNSYDSRKFGPIERKMITARALYLYFPGNVGSEGWADRLGMELR